MKDFIRRDKVNTEYYEPKLLIYTSYLKEAKEHDALLDEALAKLKSFFEYSKNDFMQDYSNVDTSIREFNELVNKATKLISLDTYFKEKRLRKNKY